MAFCRACGQDVGTSSFCPKCGANQSAATPAGASAPASAAPPSEGIQENVAGLLCYIPGIGWIIALAFFLIDKRKFVKFHAAQALGLFAVFVVCHIALGIFIGMLHIIHLFFFGGLLYPLLWLLGFVLLIFMMYKAYLNESFKLPVIGDFAEGLASR